MIVPILSIILLTAKIVEFDYGKLGEYEKLEVGVHLTTKISMLVHETQKERGATAGFIGSKGTKFTQILPKQRDLTNKRIKELNDFLSQNDTKDISVAMTKVLNKALVQLKKIQSIRTPVNSLSISAKQAISYYTKMNALFLSVAAEVSKVSTSPEISKQLVAYSNFLLSKERAGIERAVGSNTLSQDAFIKGMRIKFNNLIAAQNSFMDNFLQYASKDAYAYYHKTLVGKDVDTVNNIRAVLLNSAKKHEIISSMKELVGYGGLIHNFKNYVIRGTKKYEKKVRSQYMTLLEEIEAYKNIGNISTEELQLLANIQSVFKKYNDGLAQVVSANENGMAIKKLDKIVKVSDGPAISALNKLGTSLFSVESEFWFKTITKKINLLKNIDDYLAKELQTTIDDKYNNAYSDFTLVLALAIFSLLFIFVLSYMIVNGIMRSILDFKDGLLSFFKYVNKECTNITHLDDSNRGEIGLMAKAINENIEKVRINIDEERRVIDTTIKVLRDFEHGDLSQRINIESSNAALNELTSLLDQMAGNLELNIDNVLTVLSEYSSYNYMNKIDNSNLKAHLNKLATGVNELGDAICVMLCDSKEVGVQLNQSSQTLLQNVNIVNQSSTNAAASLEETAAALEEITGNISNNAESIALMSDYASKLNSSTKEGQELANQTMTSMDQINEQVSLINEAISIIDQIAFQTNILSLNAAVEAATAGESGKGFAVVAAEVRNLASRSAEAAKEIKEIVETANERAVEGKEISNKMITGYDSLNDNIHKTIELIRTVEGSAKEQREGIEQINDAINMQDQQTQEIAKAAHETYEIANNTSCLSSKIVDNANDKQFKGKDSL